MLVAGDIENLEVERRQTEKLSHEAPCLVVDLHHPPQRFVVRTYQELRSSYVVAERKNRPHYREALPFRSRVTALRAREPLRPISNRRPDLRIRVVLLLGKGHAE